MKRSQSIIFDDNKLNYWIIWPRKPEAVWLQGWLGSGTPVMTFNLPILCLLHGLSLMIKISHENKMNIGLAMKKRGMMCIDNSREKKTVHFSSVAQSCQYLCDPMDYSKTGFPVKHQLLELAQIHIHQVGDDTQPFHPLVSPSLPAFNLAQHQGLFQWLTSLHQVAKILEFQLQH